MPQGDQLDDYIVFLYCYTLILYCASSTWIRALFDDKTLTKTTYMLHICDVYVAVTYICQITVHICDIYVEVLKCLYIYVTYM